MLYYDKINVLKGIDTNKSNKSKEYIICHVFFRIVTINMSQRYRVAAIWYINDGLYFKKYCNTKLQNILTTDVLYGI